MSFQRFVGLFHFPVSFYSLVFTFYSLSCPFVYEAKFPYLVTTAFHIEYSKNKIDFA